VRGSGSNYNMRRFVTLLRQLPAPKLGGMLLRATIILLRRVVRGLRRIATAVGECKLFMHI
jgi:hypothetical protein